MEQVRKNRGKSKHRHFIYGTNAGNIGHIIMSPDLQTTHISWLVKNQDSPAAVNCMTVFDIGRDGTPNLILGRDIGMLQIYGFDDDRSSEEEELDAFIASSPTLLFEASVAESIRSIAAGSVSSADHDEIVVCTYSGRILSFDRAHD